MKETITLIGIVPETAIYDSKISWRDLEKIANDAVQLGPFLSVLSDVLRNVFKVDINKDISWEAVLKSLNHISFVSNVPKFLNYRDTNSNIKSFWAAIILFKLNAWYLEDISTALNAYSYVAKLINDFYIPLHPGLLLLTLRVMGKAMSEDLIQKWLEK